LAYPPKRTPPLDYGSPELIAAGQYVRGSSIQYCANWRSFSIRSRRADMKQGARTDLVPIGTKSLQDAADEFGVSRRSVARGRVVIKHGSPELIAAVESGDVAVSLAAI
jgi:hypothetical protein